VDAGDRPIDRRLIRSETARPMTRLRAWSANTDDDEVVVDFIPEQRAACFDKPTPSGLPLDLMARD
jgi:hypothetical protein